MMHQKRSRRRDRSRSDRGSVSAFVLVLMITVMCCAGLVIDGARIVGAKVSAADHAENAARVGAQQIMGLRSGHWLIDPVRAQRSADTYLAAHGVVGTVAVVGNRVTVNVQAAVATTLLHLVGVSSKTVHATRSAEPVSG